MSRWLTRVNLAGVAALVVLCGFQWSAHRRAHLEIRSLEHARQELTGRLERQSRELAGQAADLDTFREQLARLNAALRTSEEQLHQARRQTALLESERDRLQAGITNWTAAVAERDARLREGDERLRRLGQELNDTVRKFNELAGAHEKLVKDWNEQQARLAGRTNKAGPASP